MCVIRVLGGSVLFVIFMASTSEIACPFCLCFFQEMQIFHFFRFLGLLLTPGYVSCSPNELYTC